MDYFTYSETLAGAGAITLPLRKLLPDISKHLEVEELYIGAEASIVIELDAKSIVSIGTLVGLKKLRKNRLTFNVLAGTTFKLPMSFKIAWNLEIYVSAAATVNITGFYKEKDGDIGQKAIAIHKLIPNPQGYVSL